MAKHEPAFATPPRPGAAPLRRRSTGFTLIELMIVVIIIAVLAALAYPSFQRNVVETRRKAATACLLENAQFMERWYTTRLTYVGGNPTPGCENELSQFYTFSDPSLTATPTTYLVQAIPLGQQLARDTLCGTLGINQTGTKTKSGTAANANQCW